MQLVRTKSRSTCWPQLTQRHGIYSMRLAATVELLLLHVTKKLPLRCHWPKRLTSGDYPAPPPITHHSPSPCLWSIGGGPPCDGTSASSMAKGSTATSANTTSATSECAPAPLHSALHPCAPPPSTLPAARASQPAARQMYFVHLSGVMRKKHRSGPIPEVLRAEF